MQKQQQRCWALKGVLGDASCEHLPKVIHCRNCRDFSEAANAVMRKQMQDVKADVVSEQKGYEADCAMFVFKCADILLALNPEFVGEVSIGTMVHRIPHRKNEIVSGISNVNGELVLVVDIYRAMDLRSPTNTQKRMILCNCQKEKFAFVIDEVIGLRRFASGEFVSEQALTKKFVDSSINSEYGKVLVVDAELLASAITQRQI